MADTQSILQLGIEAARAGEKAEARELFRLVTREDPNNAQGWLWLAGVAEHRDEKRTALERVIEIDPANELARKGLDALGIAAPAVVPATAYDPTATAKLEPTPSATTTALASATAPPAPQRRARVYDEPELAYAPAGDTNTGLSGAGLAAAAGVGAAAGAAGRTPARTAPSTTEPRRILPAEEEAEPRRGGLAWLAFPLLLAALAVAAFFVYRNLTAGPAAVAENSPAAVASVEGSPPAPGSAEAVASVAPSAPAAESAAGEASAPVVQASPPSSAPAEASAAAPSAEAPSSAPEASSPAPSAAAPSAPAEASAAASEPAPSAAPEPSAVPEPTAAPEPTAVPPTTAPEPTAVPPTAVPPTAVPEPTTAPPPPTAPGGDVASANPAVVANGSLISAGDWDFSFNGISNFSNGPFGGAPPSRGRFEIVLITVRNNGNAAAQIPDGALVIKDGQGRVYDFNRAASVDYFNRFPDSGDLAADAPFPPSNLLSSVPLLFDVSTDATNLVLFSRENLEQGFLIR